MALRFLFLLLLLLPTEAFAQTCPAGYTCSSLASNVAAATTATTPAATDYYYINQGGSDKKVLGTSLLYGPNNLSDLSSASTARTNLGLGSLATASSVTASQMLALNTGQIYVGASNLPTAVTPSGSCTISSAGVLACNLVGTALQSWTQQGNTTKLLTQGSGTVTTDDALEYDSNGNAIDAGGAAGILNQVNVWGTGSAGQNDQTICTLTPGASVTPSAAGCAEWTLTPNQNTTINGITNLPSSATSSFDGKLIVTQPSSGGPWCVDLLTGSTWYTAASGAQPVCATAAGAIDVMPITVLGGSSPKALLTNNGVSSFLPVANIVLQSNHQMTSSSNSVTLSGNTANDFMTVEVTGCPLSNCAAGTASGAPTISDNLGDTFVQCSNCFFTGATNSGVATDIFYAKNIVAGSPVITVTWPAGNGNFNNIAAQEWSAPAWFSQSDAGIGNTSSCSSCSSISIGTSTATTLNKELVISVTNGAGNPTASTGTLIDSTHNNIVQYQLSPVVTQITNTSTQPANSAASSIGAFK